jgi:drug/metabolite transporter (DMT)-like permease
VRAVSLEAIAALLYLIIFGSVIGFGCYIWLLKVSDPARVATYGYVNPVIAVILGWLVLREPLTLRTIVATVIVVGAVMLIISDSQKLQR